PGGLFMRRFAACFVAVLSVAFASAVVSADVRTDQRVKFQLGGAVGKLVNIFGGKGAREGVTTTVAVKGNRKVTLSDTTGQIVDLSEEKIYDLDMKKKTYTVTTFAQLRAEMEKARRDAEQMARQEQQTRQPDEPSKPAEKDPNQKEFEVDFDLKNTGATRNINSFDARQTVMTVTVREKGKTLNDAGGMVMTTDMWLTPDAPSTDELVEFDVKYAQKVYGPTVMVGASPQDMAMALAMYPQIKPALDKMAAEGTKIEGTAILTEMRMEAVPPGTANQTAETLPKPEAQPEQKKGRFGGLMGGLKKMAEASNQQSSGEQKPQRSIIMTTSIEMLKLTPTVTDDVVAIPAGFKETKKISDLGSRIADQLLMVHLRLNRTSAIDN
ncbi:MAG: hypothetical protein ACRD1W_12685, partial [Vicinamibacterales bacterium]